MATAEEVAARREENRRLEEQIAQVRAQQAKDLAEANNEVALERANREGQRLEAELAALMGVTTSADVSAPPAPNTSLVPPAESPAPPASAPTGTATTTTNPAAAANVAAETTPAKPPKP